MNSSNRAQFLDLLFAASVVQPMKEAATAFACGFAELTHMTYTHTDTDTNAHTITHTDTDTNAHTITHSYTDTHSRTGPRIPRVLNDTHMVRADNGTTIHVGRTGTHADTPTGTAAATTTTAGCAAPVPDYGGAMSVNASTPMDEDQLDAAAAAASPGNDEDATGGANRCHMRSFRHAGTRPGSAEAGWEAEEEEPTERERQVGQEQQVVQEEGPLHACEQPPVQAHSHTVHASDQSAIDRLRCWRHSGGLAGSPSAPPSPPLQTALADAPAAAPVLPPPLWHASASTEQRRSCQTGEVAQVMRGRQQRQASHTPSSYQAEERTAAGAPRCESHPVPLVAGQWQGTGREERQRERDAPALPLTECGGSMDKRLGTVCRGVVPVGMCRMLLPLEEGDMNAVLYGEEGDVDVADWRAHTHYHGYREGDREVRYSDTRESRPGRLQPSKDNVALSC